MEASGWKFGWNDATVFLTNRNIHCQNVPSTSYCGYRYPGDGKISYEFTASGTGALNYGASGVRDRGWIRVYMNNEEQGARNTRGTSELNFTYSAGDILSIVEEGDSVINIHSLCTNPLASGI